MERLGIDEIIHACRAVPFNCEHVEYIDGIATDSRKLQQGDMFVALKGENFDGHEFAASAVNSGAALILSQCKLEDGLPYLLVEDTVKALHNLAKYYKSKFKIPYVGVTGSSGKTTTKDIIAAVLSAKYRVLKTEGNFNNEIGLPLTLFRLESSHHICVLEMGMSSLGEIEVLADIARPQIGVITNVGTAHIENLKTRENILKAKMEMFTYFTSDNVAVINGDNDLLKEVSNMPYPIIKYGIEDHDNIKAENIREDDTGIDFEAVYKGKRERYRVPMPGIHNVYNALSAICIGKLYGMNYEEINRGLASFKPSKNRMEIFRGVNDIKVINDVYNANPDSMMAAINVLCSSETQGRKVCILGDMFELGDFAKEGHRKVGQFAAQKGVDVLIAVGAEAGEVINGASMQGQRSMQMIAYENNQQVIDEIKTLLRPKDVVLLKGSRGMHMENIVDILREGRSNK